MATSGTYTFGVETETMDFVTEAFERCGRDAATISANDADSARRSLNFLLVSDWANRGLNLWAVDQQTINMTVSTTSYELPVDTVFVIPYQAFTRQDDGGDDIDLIISPISRQEYASISNKHSAASRPTQYYFERTLTPKMFVWPVLETGGTCQILYYRMRVLQDIGEFYQTPDAPQRWADAIAAGLAARLAVKFAPDRVAALKEEANQAYSLAASEDHERVNMRVTPQAGWGIGGW